MIKVRKIITLSLILVSLIYLPCFVIAEAEKEEDSSEGKKIFVPKDYETIKEAIDNAESGDKIYIAEGEYNEPDGLRIKDGIEIYGEGAGETKINLGVRGIAVEDNNIIKDLWFKLEKGKVYLYCADNVTLQNCVISGTEGSENGLFFVKSEKVNIINCTIANFTTGIFVRYAPTDILIKNSIVSHNKRYGIFVSARKARKENYISAHTGEYIEPEKGIGGEIKMNLEYNDIWGSHKNYYGISAGKTDISKDPEFRGPDDYHLQFTSPCIDAGDPDSKYNNTDGSRADIGALPYLK